MTTPMDGAAINLVVFAAGGWRVGFEARRVRASRRAPESGIELPSVESLMDLPVSRLSDKGQILTLKCPEGEHDILIAGSVELLSVAGEFIHPLPPLLAARNHLSGLRALVVQPNCQFVLLFDSDALRIQADLKKRNP